MAATSYLTNNSSDFESRTYKIYSTKCKVLFLKYESAYY